MKAARFPRWLLPASALSLALAGVGSLLGLEVEALLDGEGAGAFVARAVDDPEQAQEVAAEGRARAERAGADPRTHPGQRSTWQPEGRARSRRRRARPAPPRDLGAPKASALVLKLSRAPYVEQARILDELLANRPRQASRTLRELLAGDLPGTRYEAGTLRLAILARVGRLADDVAERTLLDHVAPEKPRPQRLLALGLIAARTQMRPPELDAIAREDHDAVVQAKARRLVGYQ